MATVVADYDEGCQVLISATMCNDVQLPEVIRGHTATIDVRRPRRRRASASSSRSSRAGPPLRAPTRAKAATSSSPTQPREDTYALWEHFLECIRSRNPETLCPADLGYAAIATVNLGVKSYREGKAYYFDKATGEVSDADDGWAKPLGRAQPPARQAQPGHRLEGRRRRLAAPPARLPEARRRLGRRQGSRLRSA